MSYTYRLGEKVKFTGTCVKDWREEPVEVPYPSQPRVSTGGFLDFEIPRTTWIRYRNFTDYVEGSPPLNCGSYAKGGIPYNEGIITGWRTVSPGETISDNDGFKQYHVTPGESKRVWLVAFDLRRKPVMCFDHQVISKES